MYSDFEKTNDVWTWVKEGDSYTFKNVSLDNMIAGDSVTGDTEIRVRDTGTVQIESLFTSKDHIEGEKEYCFPEDLYVLSYDWRTKSTCYKKVKYVMRHHIDSSFKKVYKCSINNMTSVNVTEDHSLMGFKSNTNHKQKDIDEVIRGEASPLFEMKPLEANSSLVTLSDAPSEFGGIISAPMKSVEEVEGFSGYVYDIEVEDTHVFFANDILVHNTDSGIFSLIDESVVLDDVIDVADTIASITNDSFPDFVKHAFNCPEDRKHTIQTDREVVSDKSLFLSKKRYIMHIVNDEGKEVDKLKIQGVEIKKSDTPKAVQDYLLKVTKMILDGYSEEEVKEEVAKMKEDFKKRPIQEIARPMSVKKLKQYYDMVDMTGSKKGIHWNGLAAMFYNSLCSTRDKKITPQDKVGILSIRHKDSKYVGFPMDLDELPDFMYDLTYDYPVMWDKSYKKINNYLESLGWDARSKKESKKEELFGF